MVQDHIIFSFPTEKHQPQTLPLFTEIASPMPLNVHLPAQLPFQEY